MKNNKHRMAYGSSAVIIGIIMLFMTGCENKFISGYEDATEISSKSESQNMYNINTISCEKNKDDINAGAIVDNDLITEEEVPTRFYQILGELTAEPLWNEEYGYDACHAMLIPMHYVYLHKNDEGISCFDNLFSSFVEQNEEYGNKEDYSLSQAHFLYLSSEYLRLAVGNNHRLSEKQEILYNIVYSLAFDYLYDTKAIYGLENTVFTHIEAVIAGKEYYKKYQSGINDAELFNLAIMSDLRYIDIALERKSNEGVEKASIALYDLFTSDKLNVVTEQDGWLFQPGVWTDHGDFAYAGNETIFDGIDIKYVDDVAWDSSHFHRFPAFLESSICAQTEKTKVDKLQTRKHQLANQMVSKVLKKEGEFWYTTTFMDGRNGVYRYNPDTKSGYQGFELSSTLFSGWWSLLDDERIEKMYSELYRTFPLKNDSSNPYLGLDTKENQNPYLVGNSAWESGWFEEIVWCAKELN